MVTGKSIKVHFIFKELFANSFMMINPEKYGKYFGKNGINRDKIKKAQKALINSLRSDGINGNDYMVKLDEELEFYSKIANSPLGTTILKKSGRILGYSIGKSVKEIYFHNYLESIGDLIAKLNLGEFRTVDFDNYAIMIEFPSIFSERGKRCHFSEGMIQGILESFTNTFWSVNEIKCLSNGYNSCLFKCRNL